MVSLFVLHNCPVLDCCSCVWNLEFILRYKNVGILESFQHRWTKKFDVLVDDLRKLHAKMNFFKCMVRRLVRSDLLMLIPLSMV